MTSINNCQKGKTYTLCVCDLEKDQRDLLYFMGLGVGEQFEVIKTDRYYTTVRPKNMSTKLGLSKRHTSKMYATENEEGQSVHWELIKK